MKLNKVFSIILFLNLFSLLLVYQRTEIIKFGYKNKRQEDYLYQQLDKCNRLKYEIEHHKSLENIDNRLFAQTHDFQLPTQAQIMTIKTAALTSKEEGVFSEIANRNRNIFSKAFFWLEHEAQAESGQER